MEGKSKILAKVNLSSIMIVFYIKIMCINNLYTSIKVLAVNNQEWNRFGFASSVVERTLREIYLYSIKVSLYCSISFL